MTSGFWGTVIGVGAVLAAESVAPTAVPARTVDNLPGLAWAFLIGWAFAGWVIANLKPAVLSMHDDSEPRAAAIAGIISTLCASIVFGGFCGLWLLTEATWDDKPLAALYAYLGAFGGGFWGTKGIEFGIEKWKAAINAIFAKKGM